MRKFISLIIVISLFPTLLYSKVLFIDPGHDYEDTMPGGGRTETEVNTNWDVANKIMDMVNADPYFDWEVILSRSENTDNGIKVGITERKNTANFIEENNPGEVYFLSIHCNGRPTTVTERRFGTLTLYCNDTFDANDQLLTRYAKNVQKNIVEIGGMYDTKNCMEDFLFYKTFHLAVLKNLRMPNCLNEIGFVDDFEDEIKLLDNNYRVRFANAYIEAFKATFSDIEVVSYSFANLPSFGDNQYFTKVNVTIKNVTNHNFSGDIHGILRHFPYYVHDDINSDFCQLGNSQYVSLSPGQQTTLSFDANVPFTMEIGMALCIESKKSGIYNWENVPTPSHKRIIKVPMNGARINGVVYDVSYNPLQGAEIWSYKLPSNKSASIYSDVFDPTTSVTDGDGNYDILIPNDWEQAVVSISNYSQYDEFLISPIENRNLTHYYKTSPIVIADHCVNPPTCGNGICDPGEENACNNCSGECGTQYVDEGFRINGYFDNVISVCRNSSIELTPKKGSFVFGQETDSYACFEHMYIIPCYDYWFNVYADVIECNNDLTETPTVFHYANRWKYDDQNLADWFPGDLSFKKYAIDCRILTEGKYYKIVLKTYFDDDAFHPEGWVSSYKYIYITHYYDDVYDDNYNENIPHSDITIVGQMGETISGNVVLKAKNSIKIYKAHISANFNAIIDPNLPIVCNTTKSAKIDTLNISDISNTYDIANVSAISIISDVSDNTKNISNDIKAMGSIEESNISIYPNPNNGSFTVLLKNDAVSEMSVINMFGQEVCYNMNKTSDSSLSVSLSDYIDGMYIVKLKGKQRTYVRKIIVKTK